MVCIRLRRLLPFLILLLIAQLAHAKVSIRFWAVTGTITDVEMYRQIAEDFESKTGIHVEVTPLAWGSFASKYFTSMAAGLPPDVGATNLGGPYDYGRVGGLVDLASQFPDQIDELEANFSPKLLPMMRIGKGLYGVPTDLGALVLIYRKDIFQKLGIKPPETWNELDTAIDKIEANGYRYYFGFTLGMQWASYMYSMAYGLPSVQLDSSGKPSVNWENPKFVDAMSRALDYWYMHDSPGKDMGSRVIGNFRSDKPGVGVPLMIDLHSTVSQVRELAPEIAGKWGVLPWPRADDGKPFHVMGGISFVLFRKSKHPEEAFQWLKYLSTVEAQRKIFLARQQLPEGSSFTVSAVKGMWGPENDDFWAKPELRQEADLRKVLQQAYGSFGSLAPVPGSVEAGRMEQNLLDQMGTKISDHMAAIASKHKLTRIQLVQAFARGDLASERASFKAKIKAELAAGYREIAPKAVQLMNRETARELDRYATVVTHLDEFERKRSALSILEAAVATAVGIAIAGIAFLPRLRRHWRSYVYIGVPVLLAAVFVFVPALTALYISFSDYHPVLPLSTAQWIGTRNYIESWVSGDIAQGIFRTAKYVAWTLPIGLILSLGCASLLNSKPKGEQVWRFLYFSPLVTSAVSVSLIFSQLYLTGDQGWLNALFMKLGLIAEPVAFLTNERTFLNCVIGLAIWHGIAFTTLVLLAGMQQIPSQLFEAAELDGARSWSRLRHVVLPGIRPQIAFVTILGVIGAFQVFETIYTLAGKSADAGARFGPNDAGLTVVPLIYHLGFETMEMGKSSAVAYVLFFIVLILTLIQIKFFGNKEATA